MNIKWLVFILMILLSTNNSAMVIGHRGASGYEPENTLASFEKAIALGVDMIEFDVHQCGSGEIVVIHDETVDRTTNGTGLVSSLTLQELKELDAGKGQAIPTLQEVLDLVDHRVKVDIEIKGPETIGPVIEVINQYITHSQWKYDDFLISSFDHYQLIQAKQLCPKVKTGVIIYCMPVHFGTYLEKINADVAVIYVYRMEEHFLINLQKTNKPIYVFTVNNQYQMSQLINKHISGIITDYPDKLEELLHKSLRPTRGPF